jgi:hypothetical protein
MLLQMVIFNEGEVKDSCDKSEYDTFCHKINLKEKSFSRPLNLYL